MNATQFTADEFDALRELTNIGMGRAGAKLSELFESKVKLSVPQVAIVPQSVMLDLVNEFGKDGSPLNIVQQEFIGEMVGRSSVMFGGTTFTSLMEYLGYDEEDGKSKSIQREILNELTNVINSASLSGLSDELQLNIHLAQPAVLEFETPSDQVDGSRLTEKNSDAQILLIDIKLEIEEKGVNCNNVISLKEEGMTNLVTSLRNLMA